MKKITLRNLTQGAVIAALYTALTLMPGLSSLAFGPVQIRVSEALTILPIFSVSGIWGLFIGCIASNLLSPFGPQVVDILFGSLATLLAAYLTYRLRANRYLALLCPVVINAVIVGSYLPFFYPMPVPVAFPYNIVVSIAFVALGEAVACYAIGLPLSFLLDKYKGRLFENK